MIPILFAVTSVLLLFVGLGGLFPAFSNSGGLLTSLFLAVSAFILTIKQQAKYKIYVRVVSSCVMTCFLLILIKSVYLHRQMKLDLANGINEIENEKKDGLSP